MEMSVLCLSQMGRLIYTGPGCPLRCQRHHRNKKIVVVVVDVAIIRHVIKTHNRGIVQRVII
eukprot:13132421-Ditylum_brightwellii.AAC.1